MTDNHEATSLQNVDALREVIYGQILPTHTMHDVLKLVMTECVDADEAGAEMWLAMQNAPVRPTPAPRPTQAPLRRVVNPTYDGNTDEFGPSRPYLGLDHLLPLSDKYLL